MLLASGVLITILFDLLGLWLVFDKISRGFATLMWDDLLVRWAKLFVSLSLTSKYSDFCIKIFKRKIFWKKNAKKERNHRKSIQQFFPEITEKSNQKDIKPYWKAITKTYRHNNLATIFFSFYFPHFFLSHTKENPTEWKFS